MAAPPLGFCTAHPLAPPAPHLHNGTAMHRRGGSRLGHRFSMAFQPIVDTRAGRVVAYEALARGANDEPAETVLRGQYAGDLNGLDQRCRVKAIELAALLGLEGTGADLCINFFPNTVYEADECLKQTLRAAERVGLPLSRMIFELNEMEPLHNSDRLHGLVREYRELGIRTAMDDFGSGFAGLSMLAAFQPDIVKLDLALTRKLHERRASRTIVRAVMDICVDLGIEVIAEGIEERGERDALEDLGIFLMQGFYLGRPVFEELPVWEAEERTRTTETDFFAALRNDRCW